MKSFMEIKSYQFDLSRLGKKSISNAGIFHFHQVGNHVPNAIEKGFG